MKKIEKKILNKIDKLMYHNDIIYFDFTYEIEIDMNISVMEVLLTMMGI